MKETCVKADLRIFPMYIKTLWLASYAIEVVKCEGFYYFGLFFTLENIKYFCSISTSPCGISSNSYSLTSEYSSDCVLF